MISDRISLLAEPRAPRLNTPWALGSIRLALVTATAILPMAAGLLLAWLLHQPAVTGWVSGVMKANTALCLVLASTALLLRARNVPRRGQSWVATGLATACALIGAATLFEYLSGVELHIDELLAKDTAELPSGVFPNRMSPTAALGFLWLGLALGLAGTPSRRASWSQALAVGVLALGLLAVIGYLYGAAFLYRPTHFIRMAPHTACGLVTLALGTLALHPSRGLTGLMTSPGPGGYLTRRLLVFVVLAPVFLGWLRLKGEQLGLYSANSGVALMVISTILTFVGIVLFLARSLEALELKRRAGETELRQAAEMTAALSRAATLEEVVDATLASGLRALGAASGGFLLLSEDGQQLKMVGTRGYAEAVTRPYATIPLQSRLPASDAVRTQTPLFLEDAAAYARHYPHLPPSQYAAHQAWAALPLMGKERMLGLVALSFATPQRFDAPSRERLLRLAWQCAQALDRALLFESEKEARALAEEATRVRDDFVSAASHELRTPIAALRLQLEILRRTTTTPGGAHSALTERVGKANRQVDRLMELVEHLLDVSRLNAGRLRLELDEVDLRDVVRDALERFSDLPAARLLSVTAEGTVRGRWDRLKLDQVVTNLVSNAVKYGEGKPIEVTVTATESTARLKVKDQGIGISEEAQQRLFQQFERAVSIRQFSGFGLGLWITRQLVVAHGGHIAVRSTPGQGAEFTVTLPLRAG